MTIMDVLPEYRLYPDEPEPRYTRCDGPCRGRLEIGQDEINEFEGEVYCSRCFAEITTHCPRCNERVYRDMVTNGQCAYCDDETNQGEE